jgi:hypothetical protein
MGLWKRPSFFGAETGVRLEYKYESDWSEREIVILKRSLAILTGRCIAILKRSLAILTGWCIGYSQFLHSGGLYVESRQGHFLSWASQSLQVNQAKAASFQMISDSLFTNHAFRWYIIWRATNILFQDVKMLNVLSRKSKFSKWIRRTDHATTLYPQKLALT